MFLSHTMPSPVRPIRQIRRTKDLYKFLFRKLSLPLPLADGIVKGVRFAANPAQGRLRERIASEIAATEESDSLREKGYLTFAPGRFEDCDAAMAACRTMLADALPELDMRGHNKAFLQTVREDADFVDHEAIFRFVTSRPLIDLASMYFGRVPVLSNASLWLSPPNDTEQQSQLFHCDREDTSVLKFFFNIEPVHAENGPFCLIPADTSDRLKNALDYRRRRSSRITDEELAAHNGLADCVVFEGPAGAGACVDTYRCLHYGSRGNSKARVVLMLRYSDYLAPYTDIPDWYAALARRDIELDAVQRLALGLR